MRRAAALLAASRTPPGGPRRAAEGGKPDRKKAGERASAPGVPVPAPTETRGPGHRRGARGPASTTSRSPSAIRGWPRGGDRTSQGQGHGIPAVDAALGPGQPLSRSEQRRFEPVFGSVVREVQVQRESPVAEELGAQALTVGDRVGFAPGRFRPGTRTGDRLLAHELAHVVQQRGAGGAPGSAAAAGVSSEALESEAELAAERALAGQPMPQLSATGGPVVQMRRDQQRGGHGVFWHVATEPPTPLVEVGQEIAMELRNTTDRRVSMEHAGRRGPFVGVLRDGVPYRGPARLPNRYPFRTIFTVQEPGRYELYYEGTQVVAAGPGLADQDFVTVSVELQALNRLGEGALAETEAQEMMRSEVFAWVRESGEASLGERAALFERLAMLRALEILDRNEREALDLYDFYVNSSHGREHTGELLRVFWEVLMPLRGEIGRLEHNLGIRTLARRELREEWRRRLDKLVFARASLLETFPGLALARPLLPSRGDAGRGQRVLRQRLQNVLDQIRETRSNLLDGSLSPLTIPSLVADVRRIFGGGRTEETRERRERAIAHAVERRQGEDPTGALAAGSVALLFVPGFGPFLAAIAGGITAGLAWYRAGMLESAAEAGVEEGLVSRDEARAARFWAVLESVLVAADVAGVVLGAVRGLRSVLPHVPAAADDFIRRGGALAGERRAATSEARATAAATEEPAQAAASVRAEEEVVEALEPGAPPAAAEPTAAAAPEAAAPRPPAIETRPTRAGHVQRERPLSSGNVGIRVENPGGGVGTLVLGPDDRVLSYTGRILPSDLGTGTATTASARRYARGLGVETDDAGHVLARIFGGIGGSRGRSLIPLDPHVNQVQMRVFETRLQRMLQSATDIDTINYRLRAIYTRGSTRPLGVRLTVWINEQRATLLLRNPQ